jgi:hypothetical protein
MPAVGPTGKPLPTTEAAILKILKTYPGTITSTWVQENPTLKPYAGDTAVQLYQALQKQYPGKYTPLQLGTAVNDVWIGGGLAGAVQRIIGATGTAVGASAKGTVAGIDQTGQALGLGAAADTCAWTLSVPVAGSVCVLSKTQARAIIAGACIGVGGVVVLVGLMLIVAEGFRSTGAGAAAGRAVGTVRRVTPFVPV